MIQATKDKLVKLNLQEEKMVENLEIDSLILSAMNSEKNSEVGRQRPGDGIIAPGGSYEVSSKISQETSSEEELNQLIDPIGLIDFSLQSHDKFLVDD